MINPAFQSLEGFWVDWHLLVSNPNSRYKGFNPWKGFELIGTTQPDMLWLMDVMFQSLEGF